MSLELKILIQPDPDGHGAALALVGDWVFFGITDGTHTGWGEATHSGDDKRCVAIARELFHDCIAQRQLSRESIREFETKMRAGRPDLVTATACSALNQALYELLARQDGVPVWRLFADKPTRVRIPVYVTINRVLKIRTLDEYAATLANVQELGFSDYKCAPFEKVTSAGDQLSECRPGLAILHELRRRFPGLRQRVDFHKRFRPETFLAILPELTRLSPVWIEEPCPLGSHYAEIRRHASCKVAAGELFFGVEKFEELARNGWADVIMPDVKHVGGFGPLLDVCAMAGGYGVEVSPHNPAGPVATAASLHCAALSANVSSLELAFDPDGMRSKYGEIIQDGQMALGQAPGWGISPEL
jgi:galactonate dehydratase